jgi:hypothetical protein
METPLEKEFNYYLAHQAELVAKYNGKVLAIVGEEVIGVYDSDIAAIEDALKSREMGTFLVQKCSPGEESYSQTYHSRVAFA